MAPSTPPTKVPGPYGTLAHVCSTAYRWRELHVRGSPWPSSEIACPSESLKGKLELFYQKLTWIFFLWSDFLFSLCWWDSIRFGTLFGLLGFARGADSFVWRVSMFFLEFCHLLFLIIIYCIYLIKLCRTTKILSRSIRKDLTKFPVSWGGTTVWNALVNRGKGSLSPNQGTIVVEKSIYWSVVVRNATFARTMKTQAYPDLLEAKRSHARLASESTEQTTCADIWLDAINTIGSVQQPGLTPVFAVGCECLVFLLSLIFVISWLLDSWLIHDLDPTLKSNRGRVSIWSHHSMLANQNA